MSSNPHVIFDNDRLGRTTLHIYGNFAGRKIMIEVCNKAIRGYLNMIADFNEVLRSNKTVIINQHIISNGYFSIVSSIASCISPKSIVFTNTDMSRLTEKENIPATHIRIER